MNVTQISIFLENAEGRLHKISSLLGQNNVNIRAISIADREHTGVLRIVVDKPTDAMNVLKQNGFLAQSTNIIAIEVEDRPGGLAHILNILHDNTLNVEYMYGFIEKFCGKALIAICFNNPANAAKVLKENNIGPN
ncbi:MAG: acetolactate synthase [Candidatus Omnitrophica bacterium]|nr:acetolactate synthase [Candidatus Omnitrophota bacterium]